MLSSTDWEETHNNNSYNNNNSNNNNNNNSNNNNNTPPPPTTISLNKVSSFHLKSPQQTSSSNTQSHRPKTMEEVWNDINLASLHDHTSREPFSVNSNNHNSNFIFQDFLATSNDPPTNRVSTNCDNNLLYGSSVPHPATFLSLNSGPGFDFLDNIGSSSRFQSSPISTLPTPTFNCPFEALASSSSLASFGKKRVQESDNSGGDRRHKRMIKNRESAARSRARKQAYTNELEHEVLQLMEENKKLREQQEQLRVAAAAQVTKKRTLHRTSTAPF